MEDQSGSRDICVVGLGVRTPLGLSVPAATAAARAAISPIADHPYMIARSGHPMLVSMDPFLSEDVSGAARFVEMGLTAADEALSPLVEIQNPPAIDILIGLPKGRPGLPDGLAPTVVRSFEEHFASKVSIASIETFQRGHTAGLYAVLRAGNRLRQGTSSLCLVGGIDSYLEPNTLEWIDERGSLFGDTNPIGFIPGEAAGFCLLGSRAEQTRLGLTPMATVSTVAMAIDKKVNTPDEVCLGEGLTAAIKQALKRLAPASAKIDQLICDMNGEPDRADEFGYTIVRVSDRLEDPGNVVTPADCWGDVGAASGPLFVALLAEAQNGILGDGNALLYTSAEGGERAAALIQPGQA